MDRLEALAMGGIEEPAAKKRRYKIDHFNNTISTRFSLMNH
jgi:hypothetical protein